MADKTTTKFYVAGTPNMSPNWAKIVTSAVAGWLVPGLGHLMSGYKKQGLILLLLLAGSFVVGLVMSDFEAVSRTLHPYAYWGQIGIGGFTLPLAYYAPRDHLALSGLDQTSSYMTVPPHVDIGVLFCVIAGILNVMVVFDCVERNLGGPVRRERRKKKPAVSVPIEAAAELSEGLES